MILTLTSAAVEEEEEKEKAEAAPPPPPLPADIGWEMLDKRRFFVLGAALFSGVSAVLYPAVLLKTRLQVSSSSSSSPTLCSLLRSGGPRALYRGFPASLAGTLPARALYMAALETTKSAASALGVPAPAANAAAGVSAALAAQAVWTPVDVVTQRLMVGSPNYLGGADAVRKIVVSDGLRGLYRGFGVSVVTYAPSNAVWWASYSAAQRAIWGGLSRVRGGGGDGAAAEPGCGTVAAVQAASAAVAGGAAAVVTMPLDTIKTRMQVAEEGTVGRTVRNLVREGGLAACYRGLAPRWASMSLSAVTMITTYEFLKRLSAKDGCCYSSRSNSAA